MPFVAAPAIIEQTDFTAGLDNVSDIANMDPNVLNRVLNLLPETGTTGSLRTRHGFARFMEELGHSDHFIKNIYSNHRDGKPYLILVLTDESGNANNVMLYEVDLEAGSAARIDTAGVTWDNSNSEHFGVSILEVFYGGSPGNDIYSWDGTTWNDDATTGDWKTLKDDTDSGINTNTEYGRDYAFTGKEHVQYSGDVFVPVKGIRYDRWRSDDHFERGERVSHQADFGQAGSDLYYKSFRCIDAHNGSASGSEPGVGGSWTDYWEKVQLDLPQNDDGETSEDWYFQPEPHGTTVGAWFADRLWLRADHVKDKATLMFSAPLVVNKGEDIPDTHFNVQDWAPGNDIRGPGGGWVPFTEGKGTGVIEAVHEYNDQLLVFKRRSVWVLSGKSEETFEARILTKIGGAVGNHAVIELDSLVYFLSDDGLYVTDGTSVQKVDGHEKLDRYLEARMNALHTRTWPVDNTKLLNRKPQLFAWESKVWIALSNDDDDDLPYFVAVYDPRYKSWWNVDLPISCAKGARITGRHMLFFGVDVSYGGRSDLLMRYDHPDSINASEEQDDTALTDQAFDSIAWHAETAWWPFSVLRAQRRIRRAWALVKATVSQSVSLKQRIDYVDSVTAQRDTTMNSNTPAYIEGKWMKDCHAINLTVSGEKAPAAVYGMAVHTEPRRARYHTG